MTTKIEIVPRIQPMVIISVNLETEEVNIEWLNCETPARMALLNLGIDIAKARLLENGATNDGPGNVVS